MKEAKFGHQTPDFSHCGVIQNNVFYSINLYKTVQTLSGLTFQGKQLVGKQEAGIVLTQQSLVLQKVGRMSSGEYECQAFNSEGYSTSNPVKLNIMCKWQQNPNINFTLHRYHAITLIIAGEFTTYYSLCSIFTSKGF